MARRSEAPDPPVLDQHYLAWVEGLGKRALRWIAAAGAIVGAFAAGSFILDKLEDARLSTEATEIAGIIFPIDHSARFDTVRAFIQAHSRHDELGAEFDQLRQQRAFSTAILARAKGLRADKVPMECTTRSILMGAILRGLGYETRRIAVFDTDTENLKSHTFLEILNPTTGRWETQDPDFDIYWRHRGTGERASLFERAETAPEKLEPCTADACGWTGRAKVLPRYLDILTVIDADKTRRSIYTTRAGPSGRFVIKGKRGTFCEVMAKRCNGGLVAASAETR